MCEWGFAGELEGPLGLPTESGERNGDVTLGRHDSVTLLTGGAPVIR